MLPNRVSGIRLRTGGCAVSQVGWRRPDNRSTRTRLRAMVAALEHRGPDGSGIEILGNVGLAHTRLAIVDPSPAGAQPMAHPDGRWVLVYNGEIFNHLELREQLPPHRLPRPLRHGDTAPRPPHVGHRRRAAMQRTVRVRRPRPGDRHAVARARPLRHQAALRRHGQGRDRLRQRDRARCSTVACPVARTSPPFATPSSSGGSTARRPRSPTSCGSLRAG